MIGCFQSVENAQEVADLFKRLASGLTNHIEVGEPIFRYSPEVKNVLKELDCFCLRPHELEQFLMIHEGEIQVEGKKIVVRTDEDDVSAFFKLMFYHGAKIELFSRD